MRTLKRAGLLTLCLIVALSACLMGGCKKSEGIQKLRLAEVTHSVFYAPMYAAIELGYFKDQGIEIELTNAGGADKAMAALLSGQTDIAFMGPEASIYVINEGRANNTLVIGQLTQCDGAFLLAREPNPDFTWQDVKGSSIIGGRKGGVPLMTLEYVLRMNGVAPGVDCEVRSDVQFNLMAGAFTGGEGDYVALFDPTATEVEKQGMGYIVASIGASSGSVPYTCYQVTKDYLGKNQALLERFLTAIHKGQTWVLEHTDKEVAEAIKGAFPDTDLDMLTTVVGRYRSIDAWSASPVMTEESYNRLLDIMEQAGELKTRPDFKDVIDNKIAEKVSK